MLVFNNQDSIIIMEIYQPSWYMFMETPPQVINKGTIFDMSLGIKMENKKEGREEKTWEGKRERENVLHLQCFQGFPPWWLCKNGGHWRGPEEPWLRCERVMLLMKKASCSCFAQVSEQKVDGKSQQVTNSTSSSSC